MENFNNNTNCVFCNNTLIFDCSQNDNVKYYTHYCITCGDYEDQSIEILMNGEIKHHRTVYLITKYRVVQYHPTNTTGIYKRSKSGYQPDPLLILPIILKVNINDIAKTMEKINTLLLFK